MKGHLGAGVAHADLAPIPGRLQGQVQPAAVPGLAQFVQRDRDRAERRGRFALQKAEALGQFVRDQVAQAHVIGQHDQPDAVQRALGRCAHGQVGGNHGHLGFEVDAELLRRANHRVARAQEIVAAALVHQRVGVKTGRHFGLARGPHQFHVVDIGRPVGPLVGARQGRQTLARIEREGMARLAIVDGLVQVLQLRRNEVPVVQHLLQAVRDAGRIMGVGQVTRYDDKLAVARAVFDGCEFHGSSVLRCKR